MTGADRRRTTRHAIVAAAGKLLVPALAFLGIILAMIAVWFLAEKLGLFNAPNGGWRYV